MFFIALLFVGQALFAIFNVLVLGKSPKEIGMWDGGRELTPYPIGIRSLEESAHPDLLVLGVEEGHELGAFHQ